jgi:hypothetical protein
VKDGIGHFSKNIVEPFIYSIRESFTGTVLEYARTFVQKRRRQIK